MGSFGQLIVCIAVVLSGAGGALVLSGRDSNRRFLAGKRLLHAAAAASILSLLVLIFVLLAHDYRISYVHDYADRTMSVGYLLMAVWGGQEGSMLLWAVLQTLFTSAVATWGTDKKVERLLPMALGFLAFLQIFFFYLVLFHSNPFEPLGTIAAEGVGLNPLLRNPYMAVHPPTLYLGFVGFSVPMAFAIAALAEGVKTDDWLILLRPFILFAWVFLSVGNILGMIWAYEELGWGGYWGWDPVENASFMPWLTGTAFLHSVMVINKRGMFRFWNLILIWCTFVLVIFGTFLTRSGVIESVHAFAGATAGPYLLGLIIFVSVVFFALTVIRRHDIANARPLETVASREGVFILANWAFVFAAAFVWLATMAPLFTELFKGEKVAVTPEFFNRWMVPIGLVLLALIALCTNFKWRKQPTQKTIRRFIIPLLVGILAAIISGSLGGLRNDAIGFLSVAPVISIGLLGFVGTGVLREIGSLVVHSLNDQGSNKAKRRSLGGQLVHLSMVLLFIGFTGSAFTEEQSRALSPGKSMRVGDFQIKFLGLREDQDFERRAILADLDVRKSGRSLGVLSPGRHTYHSHPGQPTSEVVIRTSLKEDIFLILGEGNPQQGWAVIRAVVNPLVIWIWIGGVLLVIGTVVASFPKGWLFTLFTEKKKGRPGLVGRGVVAVIIMGLGLVVGLLSELSIGVIALQVMALIGMLLLVSQALTGLAQSKGEG